MEFVNFAIGIPSQPWGRLSSLSSPRFSTPRARPSQRFTESETRGEEWHLVHQVAAAAPFCSFPPCVTRMEGMYWEREQGDHAASAT